MNILIDIAHPAHVHLVRYTYHELKNRGHKVYLTVKDIPSAIALLQKFNIPFIHLGIKKDSKIGKALLQLNYNLKVFWLVVSKKIDIGFGTSITYPHISRITRMKSIVLDDDDDDVEPLFVKYGHPFSNVVLSPACTRRSTKKLISYSGYHELAYLHPKRFHPDASVLSEIGLTSGDVFFILRFNAFKAHHDVGIKGLSIDNKRKLIQYLETKGKVFITTERNIDEEFKKYQLLLSPEKVHSLIFFAKLLIGDSQTMTSEAAVLGTPSLRCNSFVGKISYLEEEEHKYNLTFGFLPSNFDEMFQKLKELINTPNLKEIWYERRMKMLEDKIDVTSFFVWFIENYPESSKIMKADPESQFQFK